MTAPRIDGKGGGHGRSRQIDNIITDQDCTEHLAVLVKYTEYPDGAFVVFLGKCAKPHAIHCRESGLGR